MLFQGKIFTDAFIKIARVIRAKWKTDVDFNKGAFVNTEVIDSGVDAKVQLEKFEDIDSNIDYNIVDSYTLSDGAKITVDEDNSNKAALKILGGMSKNWPLTNPGNYTYESDDIVIDGKGKLKNQETNNTFFASYNYNIDATYAEGDESGTAYGGASVSGGKLDLTGGILKYTEYDSNLNADSQQVGCIRFTLTPNYSGPPSVVKIFTCMLKADSDRTNFIQIQQQTNGKVRFVMYDDTATLISGFPHETVYNFTSGVEYEIELNWALTTGANRIFINGTQLGSTNTSTGTRSSDINLFRIGTNDNRTALADFKISDYVYFSTVQHTANYTPSTFLPFVKTDPTILTNIGLAFTSALNSFIETATKNGNDEIKYQVSSDDGTTYRWWNGSAWVARTNSTDHQLASAIATTVGNLDAGNLASIQTLDASTYDVSEIGANPGFTIEIDFANLLGPPDQFTFHGYYDGSGSHIVDVDIWNYETTSWDTLDQIPDDPTKTITQYDITVTGTKTDYISSGSAKIRINHSNMGNASHDMVTDYVYLLTTPTDDGWYDNESNIASVINTNIGTLATSGTFIFNAFLHSFDGDDTPRLDNVFAASPLTYSTTDDLYIDTKDAAQIAPSTLAEWLTSTVTSTLPANTDIKLMVSIDGRSNWITYTGGSWQAPISATERQYGTSITDYQTNFESLGIGSKKLDIRLFLYTSDDTTTPDVSNINVTGDSGYELTGTYESNIYDSGEILMDWNTIGFNSLIPEGSTLILKVRASDDSLNMGPYENALLNGDDANVVGRYFQWKVVFVPSISETPSFDYFYIDYSLFFNTEVSP